jgi:membrane protease YdiL (CAAX protease family)
MPPAHASFRRISLVYALVCLAVFGVTRLEAAPGVGRYVHLVVAAIFLLTAVRLTRHDPAHFGLALGGLLEQPDDERPDGPLGSFNLGRALVRAMPSAFVELGAALVVVALVFPLYAAGYYWWSEPSSSFALRLPPNFASLALAQVVVVALPEEAFFRGYLQTGLTDLTTRRIRLLGAELAPGAWTLQAVLFAAVHFVVEPHAARLAVFFPALLFGWVRAWRGGIGAALALHAMSNLYSEILARSWL